MEDLFGNFMDGKWIGSVGETTFDDLNPAQKSDVIGGFPRSDHRDIDRAVETARSHVPAWSRVAAARRGEILNGAARVVEDHAREFATLIVRETGKVFAQAIAETDQSVAALRVLANEATSIGRASGPATCPGGLVVAVPLPHGVSAVVSHWTFPLAGCVSAVGSALAAGNTVVLKPSENAPLAAARLTQILSDVGLPGGVLGLVHGYGEEAGAPLVRHPDVDVVSFAGSADVGREVSIACAAERKALRLDVGERCVVVVLDDADLELATDGAIDGGMAFSGQRWRGATRIVMHRKVAKECTERLVARAQSLRVGDGLAPTTDVGPLISESQLKRTHAHTRAGVRDGATLLCGGEIVRDGECRRGFFYAPTVFGDATGKMRIVQDDVRGPTLVLLPVSSVEEAVEQANTHRRDVTAIVYARDLARGLRVADGVRAERVFVNPGPLKPGAPPPWTGLRDLDRMRGRAVSTPFDDLLTWNEIHIDVPGQRL